MIDINTHLSPEELGSRLRLTREVNKMTQADVANHLAISRTTLLSIEQGKRPIKQSELRSLTRIYNVTVNELLRREAVHIDLVPRFRKLSDQINPSVEKAAQLLNELASAEVELENVLGVEHRQNLPRERTLLRGDVRKQAELDALELRNWLGLGSNPIHNMMSLLELQMGVRVFVRPIKGNVSGLFAFDEAIGACILVNALHPPDRRDQTLAHECGHLVGTRRQPEVYHEGYMQNSREERYATTFGYVLLMPTATVIDKFKEITAGAKRLTRRHIIILAHYFGVSREAVIRRLEELDLARSGTIEWFKQNGGITNANVVDVLGFDPNDIKRRSESAQHASLRLSSLAAEVMDRDLMSEGQISRLLKIDRVAVRRLRHEAEGGSDDLFKLS